MPVVIPPPLGEFVMTEQSAIAAGQSAFFATHGKYGQQYRIASDDDETEDRPPGQTESFAAIAPLSSAFSYERQIDEYVGPSGSGYVVTHFWAVGALSYSLAVNEGPEDWRSVGPLEIEE